MAARFNVHRIQGRLSILFQKVLPDFAVDLVDLRRACYDPLTGKYRSKQDLVGKARGEDVEKYLDARGQRILHALDQVAERHAATPAQVALAWLFTRPGITAPIASATSLGQLGQLIGAARLNLDEDSLRELTRASDPN